MAVKVLVTQLGQHVIADTKQVSRKETEELIAYWVREPKLIIYNRDEEGNMTINFGSFCPVSDENEFSIKESHIVSILEPRDDVMTAYTSKVFGNESSTDNPEDGTDSDLADGPDGVRAESSPPEPDAGVGQDEGNLPQQI